MKKVIVIASIAAIVILAVASVVLLYVLRGQGYAHIVDTSGSMAYYGFHNCKQAILDTLRGIGRRDIHYLIPFAENDGAIKRVTYRDKSRFWSVENYMQRLRADGQYTNYDEGVESGCLALSQEPWWLSRTIILTTDCQSDPDKHHTWFSIEQLSRRVPNEFRFYIIDVSNRRYPGLSAKRIGKFVGYTRPGRNFVVFPIQSYRLRELLPELTSRRFSLPSLPSLPSPPWYPYSLYALAVVVAGAVTFLIILLRRRAGRDDLFEGEEIAEDEPEQRNGLVHVKIGDDVERRFTAPVKLTIGSRRHDDFKVRGARRREISLHISEGKELFRHRQGMFRKLKGPIYRLRSFTLKNGVNVVVRLGADEPLHRYLKEV